MLYICQKIFIFLLLRNKCCCSHYYMTSYVSFESLSTNPENEFLFGLKQVTFRNRTPKAGIRRNKNNKTIWNKLRFFKVTNAGYMFLFYIRRSKERDFLYVDSVIYIYWEVLLIKCGNMVQCKTVNNFIRQKKAMVPDLLLLLRMYF